MNKNKGITLIALIITIIVMMILVGVSVSISLNGGLFKKTQEGAFKTAISKLIEQVYGPREISKYTDETFNYNGLIPDELKGVVDVSGDGKIIYIGDPKEQKAIWAKEMGIDTIDESGYKQTMYYKELMDLARQYVAIKKTSVKPNLLALQYIRRNRYNSSMWQSTAGEIDSEFVAYVEENKTQNLDITDFKDPVTGANIDFVHSMASLNCYVKDAVILSEYACWAGDLCEFSIDIYKYKKENELANNSEELQKYSDSMMGALSGSKFGLDDMLADIDAINISKLIEADDDLDQAIYNYYYGKNVNYSQNRYYYFKEHLKWITSEYLRTSSVSDEEIIRNAAVSFTGGYVGGYKWGKVLIERLTQEFTFEEIQKSRTFTTVARSFDRFIAPRIK